MDEIIFEDIMSPGVQLSNCIEFSGIKKYPEYLQVEKMVNLSISDKLDPSNLPRNMYDKPFPSNCESLLYAQYMIAYTLLVRVAQCYLISGL